MTHERFREFIRTIDQEWEMQVYSLSNKSNIRQLTLKTLLVKLELMAVLTSKYSYFAEFKIKLLISLSMMSVSSKYTAKL